MNPADRLIQTAQSQVGYFGKKTNSQLDDFTANKGGLFNKFARDLDALGDWYNGKKNGYDYCDVWCDWCFYKTFGKELALKLTCQPLHSLGAGTKYSMNYYKNKGQFHTYGPKPGDQIFFNFSGKPNVVSHTGIVKDSDRVYVYTIEGNTGIPSAVRECRYILTYNAILGYGRPDWSLVPNKEEEEVTNEQFEKMFSDMRKKWRDNDASSWSNESRAWAIETGLVKGSGNLPDGSPNYMFEDLLTREQMCEMLYRFSKIIGK